MRLRGWRSLRGSASMNAAADSAEEGDAAALAALSGGDGID
jgi:hypothetical protein